MIFQAYLRFIDWLWFKLRTPEEQAQPIPQLQSEGAVAWFHASSVGELEMLIPLIHGFVAQNKKIAISVFSSSAITAVKKIRDQHQGFVTFAGYSPNEGRWHSVLQSMQVDRVIVAKYDAWPALWAACSRLRIPLLMINAQPRPSIKWVRRALWLFRISLPRLYFFAVDEAAKVSLEKMFPAASLEVAVDPRWSRVIERSKAAGHHARVEYYRSLHKTSPRPYGLVGSAWLEDLNRVVPAFKKAFPASATLWVVPHSLQRDNVNAMSEYLEHEIPGRYVLVNEMGILTELYSLADWVWVGGGFKDGIHSTLEPAVFNIPIACGPKNVDQFFETRELKAIGILRVCRNESEILDWLQGFQAFKAIDLTQKTQYFSRLLNVCMEAK